MEHLPYKTFQAFGFRFSQIEFRDLTKGWGIVSLAFGIVLTGTRNLASMTFLLNIALSAFTVGTAFILHELGHKFVAQRYGYHAEFRSFDQMLLFALLMSFFGFVFAAPGAVMIAGNPGRQKNGVISVTGPLVNVFLSAMFFAGYFLVHQNMVFRYGFLINAWIALFNMIPLGAFDGKKILNWHKGVYGAMVGASSFLVFLSFTLV